MASRDPQNAAADQGTPPLGGPSARGTLAEALGEATVESALDALQVPGDDAIVQATPSYASGPIARGRARFDTDPSMWANAGHRGIRAGLVGRAVQLQLLAETAARAFEFCAPQMITILGNQGQGKSRLISEFVQHLPAGVRVYHGRAEAQQTGSALGSLLRDRFALYELDPDAPMRFRAQLRDIVGPEQVAEMAYLIGGLVGLEFSPSSFLRLISEERHQRAELERTALVRLFELDAARGPMVLIIDDVHHADADTLALLQAVVASLGGTPAVVVVAGRPELLVNYPAWGEGLMRAGRAMDIDHQRLELRSLEHDEAEALLRQLLSKCATVSNDMIELALEQTGGNPLFIEQLVRLLIDNGTVDTTTQPWRLDEARAAETELPLSVEDTIATRIAALEDDERQLLERAAVFGNVFWLSAMVAMTRLAEVSPRPPALAYEWGAGDAAQRRVQQLIGSLAERDYLLVLDADDPTQLGETEVVFKHNLERELIVRLGEPSRMAHHAKIAAQWLEARLLTKSDEQWEFLAGLYERAGLPAKAAQAFIAGGDRARERYAPEHACGLYERGLAMQPEPEATRLLDTLHHLGDVLEQCGRAEAARARFAELLSLAWQLDHRGKAGAAYTRLGRSLRRAGGYDEAMQYLRRAHDLFSAVRDDRGVAASLDDMGRVHWLRGAFGQALDYHRQALTIRRALGDRRSIALSLAHVGRVHCDSGNFKAALTQFREALEVRREIRDMLGVVESLNDLASVRVADGDPDGAHELLSEARGIAQAIGDKLCLAEVLSRLGEAKCLLGRVEEGLRELREAGSLAEALGDRELLAHNHMRLANAQLRVGESTQAEIEAAAAVNVSERMGLRVLAGGGYRVLAEAAALRGETAEADEFFRKAIEVFVVVKHELELARAYRGYAQLKRLAGLTVDAQKLQGKADEIFARLHGAASV